MTFRSVSTLLTLAAGLALLPCASRAQNQEYFLRADASKVDLYLYVGEEWLKAGRGGPEYLAVPVELRLVVPGDIEIALLAQALHPDGDQFESIESGDTTLSVAKGFRPSHGADYVGVEIGLVDQASKPELSSGVRHYGTVRAQGGWTRLGYAASATWARADYGSGEEGTERTYTFGYRGQFKRTHLGFDVLRHERPGTGDDSKDQDAHWAQFIAMRRTPYSGECYGFLRRRLAAHEDDWYVGVGYRWKLPN
jgi:hypothetical protein